MLHDVAKSCRGAFTFGQHRLTWTHATRGRTFRMLAHDTRSTICAVTVERVPEVSDSGRARVNRLCLYFIFIITAATASSVKRMRAPRGRIPLMLHLDRLQTLFVLCFFP